MNDKDLLQRETTIIVKTFDRPDAVQRFVNSVRHFYPDIPICVADDSRTPTRPDGVQEYIRLPFDSGVSAGRNAMLSCVKTPYFVLSDDDNEFTSETCMELMWDAVHTGRINLAGGTRRDVFCGTFRREDRTLYLQMGTSRGREEPYPVFDYVHNFFMARTEDIRRVQWDDDLKVFEHLDFFLRGRGVIEATQVDVPIRHCHAAQVPGRQARRYLRFRQRKRFRRLQMKKHGLREIVTLKPQSRDMK
jgi:hypothetical protein